jgi:hypothetical protein
MTVPEETWLIQAFWILLKISLGIVSNPSRNGCVKSSLNWKSMRHEDQPVDGGKPPGALACFAAGKLDVSERAPACTRAASAVSEINHFLTLCFAPAVPALTSPAGNGEARNAEEHRAMDGVHGDNHHRSRP